MAEHAKALSTTFTDMREPWWNEDLIDDVDSDTDRKLDADSRRRKQGRFYKTFPNQAFMEVMFSMVHVFSLIFIPIYLVFGITLIGWVSSLNSILEDDQTKKANTTLVGIRGLYDMRTIGIVYCLYALFLLIISFLTMEATFNGQPTRIKWYLGFNFLGLVLLEITLCILALNYAPIGSCNLKLFEERLQYQMSWYGITDVSVKIKESASGEDKIRFLGYEAILKMNSIQQSLGCCGIYGYEDYEKMNTNISWYPAESLSKYGVKGDTTKTHARRPDGVPNTCCKPFWVNNIYCAEGLAEHKEQVSKRLNKIGCLAETKKLCENILYMMNIATIRAILFRTVFFMFAIFFLHHVLQLLDKEQNKAFEALLEMQRPNLPGFDLAEGMLKLKPISSKTQALPGEAISKIPVDNGSDSDIYRQPKLRRNESLWQDRQRREKVALYKSKTKEVQKSFKHILAGVRVAKLASTAFPDDMTRRYSTRPKETSVASIQSDSTTQVVGPSNLGLDAKRKETTFHPQLNLTDDSPEAIAKRKRISDAAKKHFGIISTVIKVTSTLIGNDADSEPGDETVQTEGENPVKVKSKERHRYHLYTQHVPEELRAEAAEKTDELMNELINHRVHVDPNVQKIRSLQNASIDFGDDRTMSLVVQEINEHKASIVPEAEAVEPEADDDEEHHAHHKKRKKKKKKLKPKNKKKAETLPIDNRNWNQFW